MTTYKFIPKHLIDSSFFAGKAGSFSGVPLRTVQSWTEKGLIVPEIADTAGTGSKRLYSILNCIEIGIIKSLADSRLSLKFIKKALEYIRRPIPPEFREHSRVLKNVSREFGKTLLHLQIVMEQSYLVVYFVKGGHPEFTFRGAGDIAQIGILDLIKDRDKIIIINIKNITNRVLTEMS